MLRESLAAHRLCEERSDVAVHALLLRSVQ